MDLVIADLSSNTLVPMLGNGNGTFKPPVRYLAGTQPGSLGIIPLADGNTALLTVDDVTGDDVVAFAFADGTLSSPTRIRATSTCCSMGPTGSSLRRLRIRWAAFLQVRRH